MADVGTQACVAVALAKAFSGDTATGRGLTAAEESVRGLKFDVFKEKTSCRLMTGIRLTDFESLVNSMAKRMDFPDGLRGAILESQFAGESHQVIREFWFKKGEIGSFTFGRVAALRQDDTTIDLAYAVYDLEFKLSPDVTDHEKKKKFLCFTIGKKVWQETREKDLSIKEKDCLQMYFANKAVKGFKEEYHALMEGRTQHRVTDRATDELSLKPAISYAN